MTVIVAARTADLGVVMAADSQTSAGWEKIQADRAKVWIAGEQYLVGAAGNVRAAQVVRHHTAWPKFRAEEDTDLEKFLVTRLVPAIRTAVAGHGIVATTNGVETIPVTLLIAWGRENIAEVSGDGCALMPRAGRYAIGSGYAEALGALGTVGPWEPFEVVEAARRSTISAHGCDGPIVVGDTLNLEVVEVDS